MFFEAVDGNPVIQYSTVIQQRGQELRNGFSTIKLEMPSGPCDFLLFRLKMRLVDQDCIASARIVTDEGVVVKIALLRGREASFLFITAVGKKSFRSKSNSVLFSVESELVLAERNLQIMVGETQ